MYFMNLQLLFLCCAGLQLCDAFPSWPDALQVPFSHGKEASKGTREALVEADIIPDVLDDFEPSLSILLSYPSKHKYVSLGNSLKPKAVKSEPSFNIYASDITPTRTLESNTTYTLVLIDPDATSRSEPVKAQMCHWIATNITLPFLSMGVRVALSPFFLGAKSGAGEIQVLIPYFPPKPPPKTGYHRYVFVLLAPAGGDLTSKELKKPKDRPHWGYGKIGVGVREWAEENDLVSVGRSSLYNAAVTLSRTTLIGLRGQLLLFSKQAAMT